MAEWSLAGYAAVQIARSLRPPVAVATVNSDRLKKRDQLGRGRMMPDRKLPDPDPYDWMTAPLPTAKPSYLLNAPVQRVESFLAGLRDMNAMAKLSFNVAEAEAAQDDQWFTRSQAVIIAAAEYLQGMLDVMQDGETRLAAMQPAARDDLSERQKDLLERFRGGRRPAVGGNVPSPLPEKGSGILPGRVFQVLMAWHFAGLDIQSGEVTDSIVLREHATAARVSSAAAELKPVLEAIGWD